VLSSTLQPASSNSKVTSADASGTCREMRRRSISDPSRSGSVLLARHGDGLP
jgi:hypothetical protein